MENKLDGQGYEIKILFDYLKKLMQEKEAQKKQETRKRIGYNL